MSSNNQGKAPPVGDTLPQTESTPTSVYTPERRLTTDSLDLSSLDMDISVANNGGGNFEYEVRVWNLARDTWQTLLSDGEVTISLGWDGGPTATVCTGTIETTRVDQYDTDTAFTIRGRDKTAQHLQNRRTGTWKNVSLSQVVRDLVSASGLTTGLMPERADDIHFDHWTVSPERRIDYWLDQLVAEATRRVDREWEWYAEGGQVSVVPRRQTGDMVLELSRKKSLLVFEPTTSPDANDDPSADPTDPAAAGGYGREFEAYLEPYIGRDRQVRVTSPDADRDATLYRVTRYSFESGTTQNVHHVSGEMVPVGRERGAGTGSRGGFDGA